jgi:hypothetical protein
MIIENYKENYLPKLDENKFAYYVDKSNIDIMYEITQNHLEEYDLEPRKMLTFEMYEQRVPFWIFFEKDDVEYDSDPDDSWAVDNDYDIINVVERKLMTIE